MSTDNFISYLQQLLTMVDPENHYSIELARCALSATIAMVKASDKFDGITLRIMMAAEYRFNELVRMADDFAGKPGKYIENQQKRRRLAHMLTPSC